MTLRILVVSHHRLSAEAISTSLSVESGFEVGIASSSFDYPLPDILDIDPQIVVVDANDDVTYLVRVISSIRERLPTTKILILVDEDANAAIVAAIRAGVAGCLSRRQSISDLTNMIMRAHAGESLFGSEILLQLLTRPAAEQRPAMPTDGISQLAPRERQVLEAFARGMSVDEVAQTLHISKNTIRTHLRKIILKLHVRSTREAVVMLLREAAQRARGSSPGSGGFSQ